MTRSFSRQRMRAVFHLTSCLTVLPIIKYITKYIFCQKKERFLGVSTRIMVKITAIRTLHFQNLKSCVVFNTYKSLTSLNCQNSVRFKRKHTKSFSRQRMRADFHLTPCLIVVLIINYITKYISYQKKKRLPGVSTRSMVKITAIRTYHILMLKMYVIFQHLKNN